nr:L protein - rabies virus (isolates PAS and ERA) [Lyssavirus rabies]
MLDPGDVYDDPIDPIELEAEPRGTPTVPNILSNS